MTSKSGSLDPNVLDHLLTIYLGPVFLSGTSANALISELRPTTLSQPALYHINALLDEILHLLISSSESINPTHIRTRGIPAVFSADKGAGETTGPRALGRSAVAEAELEVRSWYESHPGIKKGAFPPDGQGTGIKGARAFPVREATDLLKLKCVTLSVCLFRDTKHVHQADCADISTDRTTFRSVRDPSHACVEGVRRGRIGQHARPDCALVYCHSRVSLDTVRVTLADPQTRL